MKGKISIKKETADLFVDQTIIACEDDVIKAMRRLQHMTKDKGKQYGLQFYWVCADMRTKIQCVDLDFSEVKLFTRPVQYNKVT